MEKSNKQNIIIVVLGVALIISLIFGGRSGVEIKPEKFEGKVIAKVNGDDVTDTEIQDKLKAVVGPNAKIDVTKLEPKMLETIVREIGVQRELINSASGSNVTSDSLFKEKIGAVAASIARDVYLEQKAGELASDDVIKAKYEEIKANVQGKKEYKVRHILVKTEAEARAAKEQLKTKSFEQIAKDKTLDKPTAAKGGDLGYMVLDNFVEDFAKAVEKMKKGEVSDPVKTEFGFHIIRLEDVRDAVIPSFEEAKEGVKRQVENREIQKYIGELAGKQKIELIGVKSEDPSKESKAEGAKSDEKEEKKD
jgi:peptidyl-prolyl cis-trans isomerase C